MNKKMKQKEIIIILAILVVGFLVWKYAPTDSKPELTPNPNTASATEAAPTVPEIKTVTYTDKGFVPEGITVKQGESVTFINESSQAMSVASNPHPGHTFFPQFDQYKTEYKGEKTFVFTFNKMGVWGYHNHMQPNLGGYVTVAAK